MESTKGNGRLVIVKQGHGERLGHSTHFAYRDSFRQRRLWRKSLPSIVSFKSEVVKSISGRMVVYA